MLLIFPPAPDNNDDDAQFLIFKTLFYFDKIDITSYIKLN